MSNLFLFCSFAIAAVASAAAASAAGSGGDSGRGPLACSTDFCPIYCGNVQKITPLPNDGSTQLVHVAASMRHGARTPAFGKTCFYSLPLEEQLWDCALDVSVSHSTDVTSAGLRTPVIFRQVKYSGNGSFYTYGGNCSMGQLLPRGLKMSERNGENLRLAYGSFIPASYLADPSKVFLQSDNSDRVIASGNAVFRAIFKDDLSASYSSDSLPVVDWFVPDKSPMNPGDFCTNELKALLSAAHNSSEYRAKLSTYNDTIQGLGKTFGYRLPMEDLDSSQLFDCLFANTCEGQPAFSHFDQASVSQYFDALYDMYDFSMRFVNVSNNNYSVASYQGGPFLAQLFSLFTQIASNTLISSPVLSIHATHDTTIKPILNFFGQNSGNSSSEFGWPPYSAMLVFELRQDGSGNYFVRAVYNGNQISLPVLEPASNGLYDLPNMTAYLATNLPPCARELAFEEPFRAWALQAKQRGPAPVPLAAPSNDQRVSASSEALTWQIVSGFMMLLLLASFIVIYRQRTLLRVGYSRSPQNDPLLSMHK